MRKWFVAASLVAVGGSAVLAGWLFESRESLGSNATPTRIDSLGADLFELDSSEITRRGPGRIVVVRFDSPVELVPHHYDSAGLDSPAPVGAWAEHLGSALVFNAGQFDEDLNHLGWLKADGEWLTSHRKEQWKALLVSGPVAGASWTGVVDLEQANPRIAEQYRHVVQSMMLVDEKHEVRVRESDKTACRTVVAQDEQGRLLLMVSEGAMTLADLARWLPKAGLGIVRAMNLDGGIEAQLAISTPEITLRVYGQYGTGTTVFESGPGEIRYPLPAVVALRRPAS